MRVLTRLTLFTAATLLLTACSDERKPLPFAPVDVAPTEISAYIAVSNATPAPGEAVTVTVRARRGSAVGPIGSFTLRLDYDATRLRFVEAARAERGMVMANGTAAGVVRAAGASAEGFADDQLLSASFEVLEGSALATLALTVSELNSVKFEDHRASTRVAKGLYRENPASLKK